MVDSISSNMAAPLGAQASAAHVPARPEPAVQVTGTAAGRHGGNATTQHGGKTHTPRGAESPEQAFEEINTTEQAWGTGMRFENGEDTQPEVVSVSATKMGERRDQNPNEEM